MPAHDVSDLRDVVDAIDRLCGAMRDSDASNDVPRDAKTSDDVSRDAIQVCDVERSDDVTELVNPEEIVVCEVETYVAELWSVASSSWAESVETTASNPSPIPAEEVAGVDVDSSVVRVESVVNVVSHPIENLDFVPLSRIVEPIPSTRVVDTVPRNRSPSRVNKESVVLHATVPSVENIVSVTTNVTRVKNEPVASELFKSVDNMDSASNTSPVRPDINTVDLDLLRPAYTDTVDSNKVATHATSNRSSTHENAESDPSTRAEDMRTASEFELTCEPLSEMYYTASSEVSLLSLDVPDRAGQECADRQARDDNNGVMAGHVAAMRERFENMTRTNTPCPDYMRSTSPSLDVYRTVTPSPDRLS